MNKIYFSVLFPLLFACCSINYNIKTTGAHIVIDDKNVKHYVNEDLNFSAELSYNDFDDNIQPVVGIREKQILKHLGFDNRKDTILYIGRGSLLVLKSNKIDIEQFRVINLYDTVFMKESKDEWIVNFYRKSFIIPKTKTFVINDLIPIKDKLLPLNNKFLQRIEFIETDYNAFIDPTNVDDILFFSGYYQEVMRLTRETYHNILRKN